MDGAAANVDSRWGKYMYERVHVCDGELSRKHAAADEKVAIK